MNFDLIVAVDLNGVIGDSNSLPWHIPADLQFFKRMTVGKTVIMGSKTAESLPFFPLPNRKNIVISRTRRENSIFYSTSLIDSIRDNAGAIIIGGGKIYEEALQYGPDHIFMTVVFGKYGGDTVFPIDGNTVLASKHIKIHSFVYNVEPISEIQAHQDINFQFFVLRKT